MTISLIHDNKLWGLITCHHYSPKYITHRVRNLCNFLGSFFSNELFQRQQLDDYQSELELRKSASRIAQIFIGNSSFVRVMEELQEEEQTLLSLMGASGAAVSYQDKLLLYGDTPAPEQVRELSGWLVGKAQDYSYHTSRLSLEYDTAKAYKEKASGVMYLAISPGQQNYIMWFRPEVVGIVDWAGDPAKAVIQEADGIRLSPRKSFEKWRQVVQSTSLPWTLKELNTLPELKVIVRRQTENQLRQAEEQALQNSRIFRQNEQRYLQLMELSPAAFYVISDRRIIHSNSMGAALLGLDNPKSLIGKDLHSFVKDVSKEQLTQQLSKLQNHLSPLESGTGTFETVDGKVLNLDITFAAVTHAGKPSVMVLAREEVLGDKQDGYSLMTDQLQNYLNTDSLTELPVRKVFEQELEEDWADCLRDKCMLSLLIIDIDDFRTYNATYGLQGGDVCLQWIADVLSVIGTQHEVMIARTNGGTFMLKQKGTSYEETSELAEEIRQNVLALQIPRDHADSFVTVSVGGVVQQPDSALSPSVLIQQAEEALFKAKDQGKNRVEII
ncbi:sensor domain-containing diguanylate cyclase [Paenibacillus donghaensis]|uniref:sensor domain-containing diguanylate cyclase n=1 Tax=Paenibacillus donghaensis TaxID=414771 RepID=UPI002481B8E9|nr:sensor domain-containing diguanylate cyclase [Paenibacillus donghaensis]